MKINRMNCNNVIYGNSNRKYSNYISSINLIYIKKDNNFMMSKSLTKALSHSARCSKSTFCILFATKSIFTKNKRIL